MTLGLHAISWFQDLGLKGLERPVDFASVLHMFLVYFPVAIHCFFGLLSFCFSLSFYLRGLDLLERGHSSYLKKKSH